jgi:hypothetical protein
MTQFMKLLLVGTITGMVMTSAAIGTAAAAEPENRITILYDAFGKDGSDAKGLGLLGARRDCRQAHPVPQGPATGSVVG